MSKKEIRRQVLSWQLPTAWVALVVAALHASTARDLDGLEVFAGAKHLTAGCRSHGLLFETIELEDGADQDVLTPAGWTGKKHFLLVSGQDKRTSLVGHPLLVVGVRWTVKCATLLLPS